MSHFLNDMMQSLIAAVYPLLKDAYRLDFGQLGWITFTFQLTASILQPFVGHFTDKTPKPFSLPIGMSCSLCGLLLLAVANSFGWLLLAAGLVGLGSSVFHPEASRVARLASGGQHGLAQSVFQVGGNAGAALGPLLASLIVAPRGQGSLAWFSAAAFLALLLLMKVSYWYRDHLTQPKPRQASTAVAGVSRKQVGVALAVLGTLIFSKYFYMASMTSYYTFYLIDRFQLPIGTAQRYLFIFLGAIAVGTIIGGPIGDRIGRKRVIWVSILGVLPFSVLLPHASLFWTAVLSAIIGLILASAFSAILVYAQELMPGRVGTISGLFFGFAFGMGGIGAAVLGQLADHTSIRFVFELCAYLPAIGILTVLLPDTKPRLAA
nr:MFS transporter [Bryobacter aggregatus]